MNSWSRRRKRIILLIILTTLLILVALPLYLLFYRAPSCFDNKQNGSETGVDCGGSCQLLCTSQSLPLIIKGDPQVLQVTENFYEVVTLVENPNASGEIYQAGYTFRLYDATSSVPIKTIEGKTYVPKGTTFAIFEGPLTIESGSIPRRAVIEWQPETFLWQQNNTPTPELIVNDVNFSRLDSRPRLDAKIMNPTLEDISNIDLVALISNDRGSVFAASKTFIDDLAAGGELPVIFSWPNVFRDTVSDTDIIIRILPDQNLIR